MRLAIPIVLIVLASLGGLVFVFTSFIRWSSARTDEKTVAAQLDSAVVYIGARLNDLVGGTLLRVQATSEFCAGAVDASRAGLPFGFGQFERFVNNVSYPSSNYTSAISWAPLVNRSDTSAHEMLVRRDNGNSTFQSYAVTSNSTGDHLFPVLYTVSPTPTASVGYDLLSSPARAAVIAEALRTRAATVSGLLISLTTGSRIAAVYVPAYSFVTGELVGIAFTTISTELLVRRGVEGLNTTGFQIQLVDTNVTDPDDALRYLFVYRPDLPPVPDDRDTETFISSFKFAVAQRIWRFQVQLVGPYPDMGVPVATFVVLGAVALSLVTTATLLIRYRIRIRREQRSRQILRMVVPDHVMSQLIPHVKIVGDEFVLEKALVADYYNDVTLCFIDICDFTVISSYLSPAMLVRFLDELVTLIDSLVAPHRRILKIKTIGDAYFVAAGVYEPARYLRRSSQSPRNEQNRELASSGEAHLFSMRRLPDAPEYVHNLVDALLFCVDVKEAIETYRFSVDMRNSFRAAALQRSQTPTPEDARCLSVFERAFDLERGTLRVQVRIGVHVGNVVAGVVGTRRPQYDVWGDACNIASRMESTARNNSIQVSSTVADILTKFGLGDVFKLQRRRKPLVLKGVHSAINAYRLTLASANARDFLHQSPVLGRRRRKSLALPDDGGDTDLKSMHSSYDDMSSSHRESSSVRESEESSTPTTTKF